MGIDEDRRAGRGTTTRRTLLSASVVTAGVAASAPLSAAPAGAEPAATADGPSLGTPAPPPQPDPQLRQLLREIDPKRTEATSQKLVSLRTRPPPASPTGPASRLG